MLNMKLKNLAEIRAGYPFRSKIIPDPGGAISVVQMKDIDEGGNVDSTNLVRTHSLGMDPKSEMGVRSNKYLLVPGDILFKAKGSKNNAGLLTIDIGHAVASQQFFIIKVDRQIVEPNYITWYLNYLNDSGYFEKENEGTYIPFISKKAVSEIKIPVPSISEQLKIVQLHRMVIKEAELLDQIKAKRKILERSVLGQFIQRFQ